MKKNKYFNIENPVHQYLIGALYCFGLYVLFFFGSDISFFNIQEPSQDLQNIWLCTDFLSYSNPAHNFCEYGVFGEKYTPDYVRTIGYPAYLSIMMFIFKINWVYGAYFFNCLLIPFIFPCLYYISKTLTNKESAKYVFIFSLLLGVYTSRAIYIGTDVFFFLFFIVGIYYAVKYFTTGRLLNFVWYIVFISIASQIRPSLIYFWGLNIVLLLFLSKKILNQISKGLNVKLILISTLIFMFTCNLPSIRNYNNYGFFKPTNILEVNFFEYLAKKILYKENKIAQYDSLNSIVSKQSLIARMELQKQYTIETLKSYPKAFCLVMIENTQNIMLDNGLTNTIGNYFGYNWKTINSSHSQDFLCQGYKKSSVLVILYFLNALIYLIIYSLFALYLFNCFRRKDFWLLTFIGIFIIVLCLPTFIAGNGGSRLRIPVEWIILIFSLEQFNLLRNYYFPAESHLV